MNFRHADQANTVALELISTSDNIPIMPLLYWVDTLAFCEVNMKQWGLA